MRFHLSYHDRRYIAVKEFPPEWTCNICGETKPISKFRRYRSECYNTFFVYPMCRQCSRIHSSVYLGITVTEKVLSKVFTNVQRMPHGNHGYDFICGKGFKVDAKAACLNRDRNWSFNINHNKTADYFACVAFDNRVSLEPIHFWLIPGTAVLPFGKGGTNWRDKKKRIVNTFGSIAITPNTIDKWQEYEKPIDKVLTSCNFMKSGQKTFEDIQKKK